MTNEKKLELLADIFDCGVGDLNERIALEDLENWDSMSKLALMVLMDEEFGKTPSADEVKSFKTVGDILNYMG